jgi:hypothetical protein
MCVNLIYTAFELSTDASVDRSMCTLAGDVSTFSVFRSEPTCPAALVGGSGQGRGHSAHSARPLDQALNRKNKVFVKDNACPLPSDNGSQTLQTAPFHFETVIFLHYEWLKFIALPFNWLMYEYKQGSVDVYILSGNLALTC